jgi:hypothetical protein
MSSLMWIVFICLLVLLVLSLLWLVWRLRNFSQSHNQTVLDDRLMRAMLSDAALSSDLKKKIVRSAAGTADKEEDVPIAGTADGTEKLQENSKE